MTAMRPGIVTLVLVVAFAVGCGGPATGPPVGTVPDGERIDAARYLADAASGASAVRTFSEEMSSVINPAGPEELKRLAPRLRPPLAQAKLVAQRLGAERLDDTRLDQQRARSAAGYQTVVAAMEQVTVAAEAGDASAAQTASEALARATAAMGPGVSAPTVSP